MGFMNGAMSHLAGCYWAAIALEVRTEEAFRKPKVLICVP